jgi:hypothetical protein
MIHFAASDRRNIFEKYNCLKPDRLNLLFNQSIDLHPLESSLCKYVGNPSSEFNNADGSSNYWGAYSERSRNS